ncbi:hypothetical protein, partial [Salmonella sp. s60368]|uniref:hypothetical protein n=1 Tax=Salmonella sp. s60368 TaxID=3159723 RepID=UPI0039810828
MLLDSTNYSARRELPLKLFPRNYIKWSRNEALKLNQGTNLDVHQNCALDIKTHKTSMKNWINRRIVIIWYQSKEEG